MTVTVSVTQPTLSGALIDVTRFGATTEPTACNTAAFAQAIEAAKQQPGATITVPHGTYHFYVPQATGFINLADLSDVLLEGNGSEFIFHQVANYINLTGSVRVRLQHLTLDWDYENQPLASVGTVAAVAEDGSHFDVTFPTIEVKADMAIRIVGPFDPLRYTPGAQGGIEFRPYKNPFVDLSGQADANLMAAQVRELSNVIQHPATVMGPHTLRFSAVDPAFVAKHFQVGQCYNFRHYEYDNVAVFTTHSHDVTYNHITLYASPGSGFNCHGMVHHLWFSHCTIGVRPGTTRSVSTAVDGLHVGNSQGHILIEDCQFSGSGDDCINLHDNSVMGVVRLNDHRILLPRATLGTMQLEPGHLIELRQPDFAETGYQSVAKSVVALGQKGLLLTLSDALPPSIAADSILFNRTFGTNHYVIRRCHFTNNRARGALLQGSHGLVEDNVFENIQGAAIQIETGCDPRWSEGQGVDDLTIRRNVIRHCDLNAWQMAVIYMGVYLPTGRTTYPIFTNIRILNNTIVDCPRQAAFLSSCRNVEVAHNALINLNQRDLAARDYGSSTMEAPIYNEHYAGVIQFMHASNVSEHDNQVLNTVTP